MLVQFSQGQGMVIAINPVMVAAVQRSREQDWSVVIMAGGREHMIVGTVLEVIEKLNRVEFLATMDQG